jgi:hypothetical protein
VRFRSPSIPSQDAAIPLLCCYSLPQQITAPAISSFQPYRPPGRLPSGSVARSLFARRLGRPITLDESGRSRRSRTAMFRQAFLPSPFVCQYVSTSQPLRTAPAGAAIKGI